MRIRIVLSPGIWSEDKTSEGSSLSERRASNTVVSDRQQGEKRAAAVAAVQAEVRSGMVVGLGTGTTARFALEELSRLIREQGLELRGVPTSNETAQLALGMGIPLTDLSNVPNVYIDGADEVDGRRNLTKGGHGAMTREKCLAVASRRLVIIADESKLVRRLAWPVPVEVLPFAEPYVLRELHRRFPGCLPAVRMRQGERFTTDSGNHVIDLGFGPARPAPGQLAAALRSIVGVVEHGLFVAMRPTVYVAGSAGVRVLG